MKCDITLSRSIAAVSIHKVRRRNGHRPLILLRVAPYPPIAGAGVLEGEPFSVEPKGGSQNRSTYGNRLEEGALWEWTRIPENNPDMLGCHDLQTGAGALLRLL
ncbi:MAG: hypothetical protein GX443_16470 [Deltaproteobacteria bacterium]|nr:hypothetical protein [Deltaproteobacteria bacterium]